MNLSGKNSSLLLMLGVFLGMQFSTFFDFNKIQYCVFRYSYLYEESKDGFGEKSADSEVSHERDNQPTRFETNAQAAKPMKVIPRVHQHNSQIGPSDLEGIRPRAFLAWPSNASLPCVEPEDQDQVQNSSPPTGFLFVKTYKVGGSTAAGVQLRLARNVARRYFPHLKAQSCESRHRHLSPSVVREQYPNRILGKSFLWTMVREPTQRALSHYFHFEVSRQKKQPTDQSFQSVLEFDPWYHHHYLRFGSLQNLGFDQGTDDFDVIWAVNRFLNDYDFIAVTDRLDESIVALQLLLGLTTGDVLFLNAKNHGGYDDGAEEFGCVFIFPSFVSPGMRDYFKNSPTWKNRSRSDTLLYLAANRSLDLTIAKTIGMETFQVALRRFRHAQQVVRDRCLYNATFPCSRTGVKQNITDCLDADFGCGTPCIDQVAVELNLYRAFA